MNLHKKVDLVITLGGDGTVLWVRSQISCFFNYKDFISVGQ